MQGRPDRRTTALVRRHVSSVPFGQMFFTRDCLNYGRRSAVDQALYRLVKREVITRLARGIFVRLTVGTKLPTLAEIAEGKAKAFGRRLHNGAYKIVRKLVGLSVDDEPHIFATDGATSSFEARGERIYLNSYAPRKVMLKDTPHGEVIRALWKVGRYNINDAMVRQAMKQLERTDRDNLRRCCNVMPAWLADVLAFRISCREACGTRPVAGALTISQWLAGFAPPPS
jgi:hypothetical protein